METKMETVYIETTIDSDLVARPSRDMVMAAHQEITRQWWQHERPIYRCVASHEVLRESSQGDAEMSRLRGEALAGLPLLETGDPVRRLAKEMVQRNVLPAKAISDALHVVAASWHRVDYLLTWNCRHLANPHLQKPLRAFMAEHSLVLPEICTPLDLAGD